jgi:hypothetical protein
MVPSSGCPGGGERADASYRVMRVQVFGTKRSADTRTPLVRAPQGLTIGVAEPKWREWIASAGAAR